MAVQANLTARRLQPAANTPSRCFLKTPPGLPQIGLTERTAVQLNTPSTPRSARRGTLPGAAPGVGRGRCGAVRVSVANHPLKRTCGESPRTTELHHRTSDAISLDRERGSTERRLHRLGVLATPAPTCGVCRCGVIKRRARQAGLPMTTCCHTFRATGITSYLQNGGTIEHAQQIAAHESPRTTKLYDRTDDAISLDERAPLCQ